MNHDILALLDTILNKPLTPIDTVTSSTFWNQLFSRPDQSTYVLTTLYGALVSVSLGLPLNTPFVDVYDKASSTTPIKFEDLTENQLDSVTRIVASIIYLSLFSPVYTEDPILDALSCKAQVYFSSSSLSLTQTFAKQIGNHGPGALLHRILLSGSLTFSPSLDFVGTSVAEFLVFLIVGALTSGSLPSQCVLYDVTRSIFSTFQSKFINSLIMSCSHPLVLPPCSLPSLVNPLVGPRTLGVSSRGSLVAFISVLSIILRPSFSLSPTLLSSFSSSISSLRKRIPNPSGKLLDFAVQIIDLDIECSGKAMFEILTESVPSLLAFPLSKVRNQFLILSDPNSVVSGLNPLYNALLPVFDYERSQLVERATTLRSFILFKLISSHDSCNLPLCSIWSFIQLKASHDVQDMFQKVSACFATNDTVMLNKLLADLVVQVERHHKELTQSFSDCCSFDLLAPPPVEILECSDYDQVLDHVRRLSATFDESSNQSVRLILTGDDTTLTNFGQTLIDSTAAFRNSFSLYFIPSPLKFPSTSTFFFSHYLSTLDPLYYDFVFSPFLHLVSLLPAPLGFPCYFAEENQLKVTSAAVSRSGSRARSQSILTSQSSEVLPSFPLDPISLVRFYSCCYLYFSPFSLSVPLWKIRFLDQNGTWSDRCFLSCLDFGCTAASKASSFVSSTLHVSPSDVSTSRSLRGFDHSTFNIRLSFKTVDCNGKFVKDGTYSGTVYSLSLLNYPQHGSTVDLNPFPLLSSPSASLSSNFLSFCFLSCLPEVFKETRDVFINCFVDSLQIEITDSGSKLMVIDGNQVCYFKKAIVSPLLDNDGVPIKLSVKTLSSL
ncbi:hypothetical protein RCL1_005310 [Eukaryota sp. TZLM3-RCL]